MNTNLQYRDDNGNLVVVRPHQPLTASQVVTEIYIAAIIVAIVVTISIVLL